MAIPSKAELGITKGNRAYRKRLAKRKKGPLFYLFRNGSHVRRYRTLRGDEGSEAVYDDVPENQGSLRRKLQEALNAEE